MEKETVESPGSLSLADFELTIQQSEEIIGPLTALGRNGANNTFTLLYDDVPQNLAVLATYDGDAPPARDGHTIICTGDCLVESAPAKVVAYRHT
ncbi:MAG: hypothetical protein H6907_09370 [Hyphomicrobiales bacterium]|nr:hypothetical protein [Hyphomicrobiales bacterium]